MAVGVAIFLMALPITMAGCGKRPDDSLVSQAFELSEQRRVNEAIPLIKKYLQTHPDDAVAHYIYGKCWLHRTDAFTTLAKGEFETALALFERNKDLGIFRDKMTPNFFRASLHRDTALALLRAVYEAEGVGVMPPMMMKVLNLAAEHVRKGLLYDPGDAFLMEMKQTLESLRQGAPLPPSPPPPATPLEITT